MKKIILFLLCAGMAASASAQKNSVLLMGTLNGNSSASEDPMGFKNASNNVGITPAVGYQLTDKWTFGLEGNFMYSHRKGLPALPTSSITYGGGVFARYTLPVTGIFFVYAQADATYLTGKVYLNGVSATLPTTDVMSLKVNPGIGVNIKNGFALNLNIGGVNLTHLTGSDNYNLGYNFFQGSSIGLTKNFIHHTQPKHKPVENEGPESE